MTPPKHPPTTSLKHLSRKEGEMKKNETEKTFFVTCNLKSQRAAELFNPTPKYKEMDVKVLQIEILEGNELLIELTPTQP